MVTKRENKGRITPWVGKLADAEKLRKLSAYFKEDQKGTNIVLLLKAKAGNCGARELETITTPVIPDKKKLNQSADL